MQRAAEHPTAQPLRCSKKSILGRFVFVYLPAISRLFSGPDDLSRIALEALAAQGYRDGKLSHSEVQHLLGFNSRWETDAFLKQASAHLDYTDADLERKLKTSQQIK